MTYSNQSIEKFRERRALAYFCLYCGIVLAIAELISRRLTASLPWPVLWNVLLTTFLFLLTNVALIWMVVYACYQDRAKDEGGGACE